MIKSEGFLSGKRPAGALNEDNRDEYFRELLAESRAEALTYVHTYVPCHKN